MPVAAAAQQAVQALIGSGHTDEDFAALLEQQASASGLELVSEDAPASTRGSVGGLMPRIRTSRSSSCEGPRARGYLEHAALHGTPRPESQAIRAHVPAVLRSFSTTGTSCSATACSSTRSRSSAASTCPRRSSATTEGANGLSGAESKGFVEADYDELLEFERSDRFDARQKAALRYTSMLVWDPEGADEAVWADLRRHFTRGADRRARLLRRADLRAAALDQDARDRPRRGPRPRARGAGAMSREATTIRAKRAGRAAPPTAHGRDRARAAGGRPALSCCARASWPARTSSRRTARERAALDWARPSSGTSGRADDDLWRRAARALQRARAGRARLLRSPTRWARCTGCARWGSGDGDRDGRRDRTLAGRLRADAADPPVRERDPPAVPQAARCTARRTCPPARRRSPVGVCIGARARRLRRRHLPRPRPRARQGHRPRARSRPRCSGARPASAAAAPAR